jgi:hypothetical protein
MFKSLVPQSIRDARRRSVESIFGALGSSERTVDPDFDLHEANFLRMIEDMNECT